MGLDDSTSSLFLALSAQLPFGLPTSHNGGTLPDGVTAASVTLNHWV